MVDAFDDSDGIKILYGEERFYLSLTEITDVLDIPKETVLEMIAEEVIHVEGGTPDELLQDELLFDAQAIRSIQTVSRLMRDLGVNLPGAYLIIDLLKEIERLRFHEPRNK